MQIVINEQIFDVPMDEEMKYKFHCVSQNHKTVQKILNVMQQAAFLKINTQYDALLVQQGSLLVKELFQQLIDDIYAYNQKQHNKAITEENRVQIKVGNIARNISGSVRTCPISNQGVLAYHIILDVPVPCYNREEKAYVLLPSYNLEIKTAFGNYVYSSALNALKTEETYNTYIIKHQNNA